MPSATELSALARCHSTSCYNSASSTLNQVWALARCHSTSCYNLLVVANVEAVALARCQSTSCYKVSIRKAVAAAALARCHSTSCYNDRRWHVLAPGALARCHSTSCYNIHQRKSPLNRGLAVFKLGKGSIVGHSRVTSARFSEKGKEKEITCRARRAPCRIYSASDPSTTGPLAQTLLVAIPQGVTKT